MERNRRETEVWLAESENRPSALAKALEDQAKLLSQIASSLVAIRPRFPRVGMRARGRATNGARAVAGETAQQRETQ